jgi:hypothetical protein
MPPPGSGARQLELAFGEALRKERSMKRGVALTLGVAGGVCLIAASAIHRNLLVTVAPAAAGLLGSSAALWVTSQNRRNKGNPPLAFRDQLQDSEHIPSDTLNKHVQGKLQLLDSE